jgi:glycosyltransferase involved in cell wall biosynthesis
VDSCEVSGPLVSCIVPVYNGAAYLAEALDSIFAQSYRPLEVIVVDDGSTDGTPRVLADYAARVTRLWQPNGGPAAARNRGVTVARGECVAFLDADDLWHPEKLARQMARFRARPELELSLTGIQNFWMAEAIPGDDAYLDAIDRQAWPGYVCQTLLTRRATFQQVGPFNESLPHAEDREWLMRAVEHGKVRELLPEVLVYRRCHRTNLTRGLVKESYPTRLQLVRASLHRRRARSSDAHSSGRHTPKTSDRDGIQ